MSIKAVDLVLNHSRAVGTDKVILFGIAHHDGDAGAWPAIDTLAHYANVNRRNARKSIQRLVEMGELQVLLQQGGTSHTRADRRTNRYVITVKEPVDNDPQRGVSGDPASGNGGSPATERGVSGDTYGGSPATERGVAGDPQTTKNHPGNHPPTTRDSRPRLSDDDVDIPALGGVVAEISQKIRSGQSIPAEEPWSGLTPADQKAFERWLETTGAQSGPAVRRSLQKRRELGDRIAEWREKTKPKPDFWEQVENSARYCESCGRAHSPRIGCQAYSA